MLLAEEIAEEYDVEGMEVETPHGWRAIKKVYKTVPMEVWEMTLEDGYTLRGSKHHLVKAEAGWRLICDLTPGEDSVIVNALPMTKKVVSIVNTGETECLYDITVDSPDGAFFSNGILSHNSTTFCCRQLSFSYLFPRYRGLYIAPSFPMLETYASRLLEMSDYFRAFMGKQNKYSKRYANGSMLDLAYCLESARDVRGKTVDECMWERTPICTRNPVNGLDEYKQLRYIIPGDEVKSLVYENGKYIEKYNKVVAYQPKGTRPCWRLRTSGGKSVVCTANHKLRASTGWIYVADIIAAEGCTVTNREGQEPITDCTCSRHADRDTFRGRQYDSHSAVVYGVRVQRDGAVQSESGRTSGGLRVGKSCHNMAVGIECRGGSREESWLRECLGSCEHFINQLVDGLLGDVLWVGKEGCYRGDSSKSYSGGDRLVANGRRVEVERLHSVPYSVFFEGGSGASYSASGADGYFGREGAGSKKQEHREGVQHHSPWGKRVAYAVCDGCPIHTADVLLQTNVCCDVQNDVPPLRRGVFSWAGAACGDEASLLQEEGVSGCAEENMVCTLRGALRGKESQNKAAGKRSLCAEPGETGEAQRVCTQNNGEVQGQVQRDEAREESSVSSRESSGDIYGDMCLLRKDCYHNKEGSYSAAEGREALVPGVLREEKSRTGQKLQTSSSEEKTELITTDGPEEIISVEYVGLLPVADIQVAVDECYVANGILSHNCLIDESQNVNPDLLPEILYTQTMSKMPMTIYAGTALSTDTLLEDKWRASSMGMWHVRAMDGKHWLNMYDKDTLKKVCSNPLGPKCPYTGKLLDVTNGCYVHASRQALEAGNIGIHVPQCIIKDIAEDPVQWGKVYKHIQEDDFKKVLQECFGIAVAEGTREITQQDLQKICVIQATEDDLVKRCKEGYYRMIISGADWGGSDYNQAAKTKKSYTVHCIIGLAPDGIVDILHYRRYSGMDYHTIAKLIVDDHVKFKGKVIATDFGVGMAYNNEIRRYLPLDRHFVMDYVGPSSAAMATPKGEHLPNQIALNRTEALTNVFRDLKLGKLRARTWDASANYLLDWLNMFRVPTETAAGKKTFLYRRNPQKSDDSLHAFNFAYAMMKFYKGESLVEDPELTKRINSVLRAVTPQQQAAALAAAARIAGNTQFVISG